MNAKQKGATSEFLYDFSDPSIASLWNPYSITIPIAIRMQTRNSSTAIVDNNKQNNNNKNNMKNEKNEIDFVKIDSIAKRNKEEIFETITNFDSFNNKKSSQNKTWINKENNKNEEEEKIFFEPLFHAELENYKYRQIEYDQYCFKEFSKLSTTKIMHCIEIDYRCVSKILANCLEESTTKRFDTCREYHINESTNQQIKPIVNHSCKYNSTQFYKAALNYKNSGILFIRKDRTRILNHWKKSMKLYTNRFSTKLDTLSLILNILSKFSRRSSISPKFSSDFTDLYQLNQILSMQNRAKEALDLMKEMQRIESFRQKGKNFNVTLIRNRKCQMNNRTEILKCVEQFHNMTCTIGESGAGRDHRFDECPHLLEMMKVCWQYELNNDNNIENYNFINCELIDLILSKDDNLLDDESDDNTVTVETNSKIYIIYKNYSTHSNERKEMRSDQKNEENFHKSDNKILGKNEKRAKIFAG